jgi:hypothetical protein
MLDSYVHNPTLREGVMPILTANVPHGGDEVISRAIAPLFLQSDEKSSPVGSIDAEGGTLIVEPAAPHMVFVVGLDDISEGRLLASARQDGWRYLLLRGEEAVASATLEQDDETGGVEFSHLTQGPFVDSTVEGIRRVEALPQVEVEDFELRLLDAPALYLRTLWLHGNDRDLLVPLAPAPPSVEPYRAYTENELLDAIRDSAQTRLGDEADVGG